MCLGILETHLEGAVVNVQIKPQNLFLNVSQVAARYNVSTDTIWRWTRLGDMPRPKKVGLNVTRWLLSDLEVHERGFSTEFVISAWPFGIAA